jgi:hypothetical protein
MDIEQVDFSHNAHQRIQISQAISLKRIADALDFFMGVLKSEIDEKVKAEAEAKL